MNEAIWIAIVSTTIPLFGAGIGYLIKFVIDFRHENKVDHDVVMNEIKNVKRSVDKVGTRLNDHIEWHVTKK
jgi:hypothetical protein